MSSVVATIVPTAHSSLSPGSSVAGMMQHHPLHRSQYHHHVISHHDQQAPPSHQIHNNLSYSSTSNSNHSQLSSDVNMMGDEASPISMGHNLASSVAHQHTTGHTGRQNNVVSSSTSSMGGGGNGNSSSSHNLEYQKSTNNNNNNNFHQIKSHRSSGTSKSTTCSAVSSSSPQIQRSNSPSSTFCSSSSNKQPRSSSSQQTGGAGSSATTTPQTATTTVDFEPDRPIGYGAFGVVWSVTDPRDAKRVALKKLPNVFQSLVSGKRVFRELRMMCFFRHENVLSCRDILQPPSLMFFHEIYLITELMQSDLHKIIVSPQPLSADHIKVFLYQILRGVKYLHSARIIHRDIKPGNLLVNSNCILKICDFGLARVEEENTDRQMTQEVVTQYYRAPEILMGARHYDMAVDMWSIGCIFGELLGRRILFQAASPIKQLELITDILGTPHPGEMRFACDAAKRHVMSRTKKKDLSALYALASGPSANEAIDLLLHLLTLDPDHRITVYEALNHRYLDEGRLRYHSCMCSCCVTTTSSNNSTSEGGKHGNGSGGSTGGGVRQYAADLEPESDRTFSDEWELSLTSIKKVKESLYQFINDQIKCTHVPLCINPHSAAFKSFASSKVAHPSELPPSPHHWQ